MATGSGLPGDHKTKGSSMGGTGQGFKGRLDTPFRSSFIPPKSSNVNLNDININLTPVSGRLPMFDAKERRRRNVIGLIILLSFAGATYWYAWKKMRKSSAGFEDIDDSGNRIRSNQV